MYLPDYNIRYYSINPLRSFLHNHMIESDCHYCMRRKQTRYKMSLPISVNKDENSIHHSNYTVGFLSCLFYTVCSVSTVIANKYISFGMPIEVKENIPDMMVILIQCFIAVVMVEFARYMKWVDYAPMNIETAKSWLPVNILFIGMLCSSFICFIYVSVPMITIFKNLTNLVTVAGDWYFFNEK